VNASAKGADVSGRSARAVVEELSAVSRRAVTSTSMISSQRKWSDAIRELTVDLRDAHLHARDCRVAARVAALDRMAR
jgi:hypothetical protein